MKQTIRLTESELRRMIKEAVSESINEDFETEGFWNQMKTGAKTFASNRGGFKSRWDAAKKNYQTQGQMDQMDDQRRHGESQAAAAAGIGFRPFNTQYDSRADSVESDQIQ